MTRSQKIALGLGVLGLLMGLTGHAMLALLAGALFGGYVVMSGLVSPPSNQE